MQAKKVHDTGNVLDYTPASAVEAGDVVVQKDLVGVAACDIAADELGAIEVGGVFDLLKSGSSGPVFAVDDPVYWDDTNNLAVATPASGVQIGVCVKAAATGDTTVRTKLIPRPKADHDLLYSNIAASTAVTNTTTETAFDKAVTIPANTLKVGDVIRVRAQAIATLTNATDTLDLQLRLGTTDILATGAVDVANNDIGFIDADIVVRTVGASGTIVAAGHTALGVPGTVTAKPKLLGSTTLDTTADQSVNVSATWGAANAGNSVRLDILNVQLIRK